MATDATGTPTALGIPKFNTSVDAPSGLGSNAQMDSIDTLIQANTSFQASGIVIKGNKLLSADANTAFSLFGDGTMKWGAGGASALDTTLARTGAGVLRLTGTFNATAGLQVNGVGVLTTSTGVASVFGRNGTVVATSGDYTVAQVTGAAPTASPTFTGTVTLPTAITTAALTTVSTATTNGSGLSIGQNANANVSFFGATPTSQYSTASAGNSSYSAGAGGATVQAAGVFTGSVGTTGYTVGDIVRQLKLMGIMAP